MLRMAFKRTWITAQLQATQAMKRYFETPSDRKGERAKLMFQAQQLVTEAHRLDERGPITD